MAQVARRSDWATSPEALSLLEYDFEVQYRKGALNVVPDFLSRFNQDLDGPEEVITMDKTEDTWYLKCLSDVQKNPRAFPMWKVEKGVLYHHSANKWLDPILPDVDSWKMVLPKEHHVAALAEAHDQPQVGHLSYVKLTEPKHRIMMSLIS